MVLLPRGCLTLKLFAESAGARQQSAIGKLFEHRQCSDAGGRVAAERPAKAAGAWGIHDLSAAGDSGQGQATSQRLGSDNDVGLDAEMSTGEEFSGAAEAGLYFVGNKDDATIATDLRQSRQKASGRHDKSTFTQYRLDDDGRNGFSSHHATKGLIELVRYLFHCHRSAVGEPRTGRHAKRDAVNIRQKGAEPHLVRVSLAGKRHAQHGAAVKSVFDRDNRGTAGESSRDLHRVLYRLCSAVDQKRLLGKFARGELVELLREFHVAFVASHLKAKMEKRIQLGTNGA